MSSRINTILIIGGTSGIGEALTRRFHSMGKKVITTGRNKEKLGTLAKELKGLETYAFDMSDLAALPGNAKKILDAHPDLDTVLVNAGIQKCYNLFDPSTTSAEANINEISTNLTAPILIAQSFAPHLLKLAQSGKPSTIMITSSSLAYIPLSFYPTYCATKAGVHAFTKTLRQQLYFAGEEARKNMNVVEIVPPYVDTGLDAEHRELTIAMQGGKDKAFPAQPLNEYIEEFFKSLEQTGEDGSLKKEIGVGFGEMGAKTWRDTFEPVYQSMGLTV